MTTILYIVLGLFTGLKDMLRGAGEFITAKPSRIAIAVLLAVCAFLAWRLSSVDGDRDDWRGRSKAEAEAHAQTVANYRAAALTAEIVQSANLELVKAEQEQINAETLSSYQQRIAALRGQLRQAATADPRSPGETAMPGASDTPGGIDEATDDVLSADERLIAAEQAIQLDELITWVERQAGVETSPR